MGNGVRINCFVDPWLLRPTTFKPHTKGGPNRLAVRDLFLVQGVWNEAKIDQHFVPADS